MKKEKSCSVIISRQEHGISRKLMNPNALRILYRLRDNGYVGYLVGGCVRALLLGREAYTSSDAGSTWSPEAIANWSVLAPTRKR